MPGMLKEAFDWATTSPEFVKKKARELHGAIESPSVFDAPYEKYTKHALHAAIDTADSFATPADAAALLAGGAGFAGAEISNRLRRLPKVGNVQHYTDARRLGKTHEEAIKIASSGGRTAADRARMAESLETQFGRRTTQQVPPPSQGPSKYPNAASRSMADMVEAEERARKVSGPVRQTAGRGKSIIDLAESVRKNTRSPYYGKDATRLSKEYKPTNWWPRK